MFKLFRSSALAGFTIGLAGFGYLTVGGVPGAVVFAFGLLTVIAYGLKLFTGTAGFYRKRRVPFSSAYTFRKRHRLPHSSLAYPSFSE